MRTAVLFTALVLAAPAALLVGCSTTKSAASGPNQPDIKPVPVRIAAVEHTRADLPVRAVGKVAAKEELRLSFKIGGIIEHMLVDEGESVEKGELLAGLSLTEIDAQLTQAQNGFDKADRDLKRVKNLFADTVATLEQLQNATTAWEVARATLDAALFNREHAQIFAPAAGCILRRLADNHEQVTAGSPVIVLSGYEKGWVMRSGLADVDFLRIKLGDSARIEFDALPGTMVGGTVSEIGAAANPINGTYEIEIKVGPTAARLVSGLVGKISITPTTDQLAAMIPIEALVEANELNGYVYVPSADGRSARRAAVTVAYLKGGLAVVHDPSSALQMVITAGASRLSDGAAVVEVK
ncbi:MAG: efflux RND transporter periplasmic adaptor subunit [Candidatus Zixiibacteriota bacterium]